MNPNNETKIIGTMCRHKNDNMTIPSNSNCLTVLNDSNFKKILMAHKKRKLEEPDRPEFETNDIRLRDVHARTQNSNGYKRLSVGRPLGRKTLMKLAAKQLEQSDNGVLPCILPSVMQQQQQQQQQKQKQQALSLPSTGNQQQLYKQQTVLTNNNNAATFENNVSIKQEEIDDIKQELNSSDSENHTTTESETIGLKKLIPNVRRTTTIEDNVIATKTKNLPPLYITSNNSTNKGSIISPNNKKMIFTNVNGTTVPEKIHHQNLTANLNMKNKSSLNTTDMPTIISQQYGKVKAATLSDLEDIDMMHIPVDLDESENINFLSGIKQEPDIKPVISGGVISVASTPTVATVPSVTSSGTTQVIVNNNNDTSATATTAASTELMQETHACFLSLIRDIFCSTPNHRIKLDDLKSKIYSWLSNPITALNDWYSFADNWLALIPSAIHFLTGEFVDQPEDFVPYVEFKPQLNIYQWIGAGRDSDQHLIQLCNYWLNRKNEMGCKPLQKFELNMKKSNNDETITANAEQRPTSPPPPRCPTNWTVRPATTEELIEFRAQEKKRFENPHKAFTYRMHGYESVVGPVKGIYTQILSLAKARGHNMLTQDRPNYVTILTLVRDATARLPNGEGTRADICELLKSSQYISPDAQDSVLTTIVSGALDRMHTEHDPCVR